MDSKSSKSKDFSPKMATFVIVCTCEKTVHELPWALVWYQNPNRQEDAPNGHAVKLRITCPVDPRIHLDLSKQILETIPEDLCLCDRYLRPHAALSERVLINDGFQTIPKPRHEVSGPQCEYYTRPLDTNDREEEDSLESCALKSMDEALDYIEKAKTCTQQLLWLRRKANARGTFAGTGSAPSPKKEVAAPSTAWAAAFGVLPVEAWKTEQVASPPPAAPKPVPAFSFPAVQVKAPTESPVNAPAQKPLAFSFGAPAPAPAPAK